MQWNPNPAITALAVAYGTMLVVINPKLGASRAHEGTDKLIEPIPPVEDDDTAKKSVLNWSTPSAAEFETGIRYTIPHKNDIGQANWHHKGNYLSTVMPQAEAKTVFIHALLRQHSQSPLSKKSRDVQCVAFHPAKPFFFVAVSSST